MKTSMRLFIWLAAVAVSTMPAAAQPSCGDWNSEEFFSQATARYVETCVHGGGGLDTRDEYGWTPLHYAAAFSDNPDMATRLIELGADLDERMGRQSR